LPGLLIYAGAGRNQVQMGPGFPGAALVPPGSELGEHFAWADLAVSAAGLTKYELALFAVPAIIVAVADNQETVAGQFAVAGSARYLGRAEKLPAVALGARMIEKHFTLSREMKGPDHPFALEPGELAAMVRAIRETEQALGSPVKRRTAAEEELYRKARRGLVAARAIRGGERIARRDLEVKRPGYGISPVDLPRVVGRRAARDLRADEILTWEMLA